MVIPGWGMLSLASVALSSLGDCITKSPPVDLFDVLHHIVYHNPPTNPPVMSLEESGLYNTIPPT
jgi:hypothetical protein